MNLNQTDIIKNSVSIFDVMDKLKIEYDYREEHNLSCPFHADDHPSMRVYPDTNKCWCFVCGKVWDVIELVVDYTSMDFKHALSWLEATFKIDAEKSSLKKFFALATKEREIGDISAVVQDVFIESYRKHFYISLFVWERIFHCWDLFERIDKKNLVHVQKWFSYCKTLVEYSFVVQHEIFMMQFNDVEASNVVY